MQLREVKSELSEKELELETQRNINGSKDNKVTHLKSELEEIKYVKMLFLKTAF